MATGIGLEWIQENMQHLTKGKTQTTNQKDVLPITLDGGSLEQFPNAQRDNGLFKEWNTEVLPALFAVNPKTGHVIPIAFGLTGIDQMELRIMKLVGKN